MHPAGEAFHTHQVVPIFHRSIERYILRPNQRLASFSRINSGINPKKSKNPVDSGGHPKVKRMGANKIRKICFFKGLAKIHGNATNAKTDSKELEIITFN